MYELIKPNVTNYETFSHSKQVSFFSDEKLAYEFDRLLEVIPNHNHAIRSRNHHVHLFHTLGRDSTIEPKPWKILTSKIKTQYPEKVPFVTNSPAVHIAEKPIDAYTQDMKEMRILEGESYDIQGFSMGNTPDAYIEINDYIASIQDLRKGDPIYAYSYYEDAFFQGNVDSIQGGEIAIQLNEPMNFPPDETNNQILYHKDEFYGLFLFQKPIEISKIQTFRVQSKNIPFFDAFFSNFLFDHARNAILNKALSFYQLDIVNKDIPYKEYRIIANAISANKFEKHTDANAQPFLDAPILDMFEKTYFEMYQKHKTFLKAEDVYESSAADKIEYYTDVMGQLDTARKTYSDSISQIGRNEGVQEASMFLQNQDLVVDIWFPQEYSFFEEDLDIYGEDELIVEVADFTKFTLQESSLEEKNKELIEILKDQHFYIFKTFEVIGRKSYLTNPTVITWAIEGITLIKEIILLTNANNVQLRESNLLTIIVSIAFAYSIEVIPKILFVPDPKYVAVGHGPLLYNAMQIDTILWEEVSSLKEPKFLEQIKNAKELISKYIISKIDTIVAYNTSSREEYTYWSSFLPNHRNINYNSSKVMQILRELPQTIKVTTSPGSNEIYTIEDYDTQIRPVNPYVFYHNNSNKAFLSFDVDTYRIEGKTIKKSANIPLEVKEIESKVLLKLYNDLVKKGIHLLPKMKEMLISQVVPYEKSVLESKLRKFVSYISTKSSRIIHRYTSSTQKVAWIDSTQRETITNLKWEPNVKMEKYALKKHSLQNLNSYIKKIQFSKNPLYSIVFAILTFMNENVDTSKMFIQTLFEELYLELTVFQKKDDLKKERQKQRELRKQSNINVFEALTYDQRQLEKMLIDSGIKTIQEIDPVHGSVETIYESEEKEEDTAPPDFDGDGVETEGS